MKIIFLSDIHGLVTNFKKIENIINDSDKIVFLGDSFYNYQKDIDDEYDPEYLINYLKKYKEKIIYINGNCDYYFNLNFETHDYYTLEIDNMIFNLIHGHIEYLKPKQNEFLIYGHTHIPIIKKYNGYYILNPGSLSLPKEGISSYMIYENNVFTIYDIDENILDVLKLN